MFPNNNQNKPPGFNLNPPQLQQPNEWNINNCPWAPSNSQGTSSSGVMQFGSVPAQSTSSSPNVRPQQPGPSWSGNVPNRTLRTPRTKRRSESDTDVIPAKQLITEEAMITRLSSLRLADPSLQDDFNIEESDDEAEMPAFPVNLTPQELENRLKNASRITVMKSVQNALKQNPEMAIPPSILERIENQPRQSMAVVLWQPPLRFLGQPTTSYDQPTSSSEEEDDPFMDANNNNNNNDPNNNNNNDDVEDMDL